MIFFCFVHLNYDFLLLARVNEMRHTNLTAKLVRLLSNHILLHLSLLLQHLRVPIPVGVGNYPLYLFLAVLILVHIHSHRLMSHPIFCYAWVSVLWMLLMVEFYVLRMLSFDRAQGCCTLRDFTCLECLLEVGVLPGNGLLPHGGNAWL